MNNDQEIRNPDKENVNQDDEEELFEHFRFTVDKGQEPVRIDKYLLTKLKK